jgi:localization factor PodJL
MAADGVWPGGREPESARTAQALDELRLILDRLEARISRSESPPLAPDATAALIQAIDGLAGRLAAREASDDARGLALSRALAALSARLDAELETPPEAPAAREPALVRWALMLGAASAVVSLAGAGISLLAVRPDTGAPASPETAPVRAAPSATAPLATGALPAIRGVAPAAALAPVPMADRQNYAEIVAALSRGDAMALPRLAGLADGGDVEAQLHLASLYETGGGGLPRDLAAARLWTRRAAEGGDKIAMHNLGLFLAQGEGGVREVREAALWFRRAAERGVVDSQYNLGLIHETGQGVPANLGEAYRWFSVAANAGDLKARQKQIELEGRLSPVERAAADREASLYRPGATSPGSPAPVAPPALTVADSQALLARRGYYLGPADGQDSAAYRAAVEAYLKDQTKP